MQYTHYDYLELAPGAGREAVDAAYARRLQQLGQGHSALLRHVHAAYEVLGNPIARRAYDVRLAQEAALADAELKALLDGIALEAPQPGSIVPIAVNADTALAA